MPRPPLKAGEHGNITVVTRDNGYEARCRVRGLDGRIRQIARRGRTKGAARAALADALKDAAADRSPRTFGTYVDDWYRSRTEAGLAQRTLDKYAETSQVIKSAFGGVLPQDLRASQVQALLDGRSLSVATSLLTPLRGAVKAAARDGALDRDPLLGVEVRRAPGGRDEPRALTVEQFKAFRAHMAAYRPVTNRADPEFMRVIDWIAASGCRTGEALGVQGEHVRGGVWEIGGTLIVPRGQGVAFQPHTKAHDRRAIVLPRRLTDGLPIYGIVFPSAAGTFRDPSTFRAQWRRRTAGSQWGWVTPKTLRKTVATVLSRQLGSEAAALALGHSSDVMTRRYYIEREQVRSDFGAVLGELFDGVAI